MLFYGPQDLRYEEIAKPKLGPFDLLVKVEAALTGGTDTKTYLRGHPRIIKSTPSTFGYEFAGTVVELGVGLQAIKENKSLEQLNKELKNLNYKNDLNGGEELSRGDYDNLCKKLREVETHSRVVSANTAPCYKCFFCNKEEYSLCENLDFLNGSFAQYIKIPERIVRHNLYKIPDSLNFREAAMTQTLAVALHGFQRSNIKPGDTVAVYGLGPIGLTFIKLCKNYIDNVKVIALGRSEMKRNLAKNNGADLVIDISDFSSENFAERVKEESQGIATYGADIVIEAVGKPETWTQSLELVRPGGLINFFGGCPKGSKAELDTFKLHYQEVRTIGVFHHTPKYIQEALSLISSSKVDMKDLISHEMKLEDLEEALKLSINGEALKVCIKAI